MLNNNNEIILSKIKISKNEYICNKNIRKF